MDYKLSFICNEKFEQRVPNISSRGQYAPTEETFDVLSTNTGNWFLQSDWCRFLPRDSVGYKCPIACFRVEQRQNYFLSAAFCHNSLRYPLWQRGIITLDVDVVSWRVPTSSDGSAVLWFILNIFSLPPFSTNYFTNFTFVVACLYVRRKLKTVVQDVCSGLEEAVLQSQPGLQNFLPSLC